MKPTEVARYLQRAALDDEFRALARADPDASFEGYALSDAEKEILRRRDHEMMRLLAGVLREAEGPEGPQPEEHRAVPDLPPVTGQVLPPVDLILQLSAIPSHDDAGGLRLAHVASLHVAPAPGAPLPPPPAGAPEGAMAPVNFRIRVAPHAAALDGGRVSVTYAATILALGAGDAPEAPAAAGTAPVSPWDLRVTSEEARRAADAVMAAAPADRHERLFDLVAALRGSGEGA